MGRLAGFSYREIIKKLKILGFEFYRNAAGSHEIWYSVHTDKFTTVARHNTDMPEGTLKAVLKQGCIETEQFLIAK
jgi:predicted RNA binding protein YcfA (HicA-like mRNA interferase family)